MRTTPVDRVANQGRLQSKVRAKKIEERGGRAANQQAIPMARVAQPLAIARCVLFLASDESSHITRSKIVVDGRATSIGLPRVRNVLADQYNRCRRKPAAVIRG